MIDNITVNAVKETCLTAKTMTISNAEENSNAVAYCQGIKKLIKQVNSVFKPVIDAQKQALKTSKDEWDKYIQPLEQAEMQVKKAMQLYLLATQVEIEKKQRELEAEALKIAETRRLEQASKLESQGKKEEAEKLLNKPVTVQAVQIQQQDTKGQNTIETWKGEVKDKRAFLEACLNGTGHASLDMVSPENAIINKIVRVFKGNTNIAGVEPVMNVGIAIRE